MGTCCVPYADSVAYVALVQDAFEFMNVYKCAQTWGAYMGMSEGVTCGCVVAYLRAFRSVQ